jgi:hypothetical protein
MVHSHQAFVYANFGRRAGSVVRSAVSRQLKRKGASFDFHLLRPVRANVAGNVSQFVQFVHTARGLHERTVRSSGR